MWPLNLHPCKVALYYSDGSRRFGPSFGVFPLKGEDMSKNSHGRSPSFFRSPERQSEWSLLYGARNVSDGSIFVFRSPERE